MILSWILISYPYTRFFYIIRPNYASNPVTGYLLGWKSLYCNTVEFFNLYYDQMLSSSGVSVRHWLRPFSSYFGVHWLWSERVCVSACRHTQKRFPLPVLGFEPATFGTLTLCSRPLGQVPPHPPHPPNSSHPHSHPKRLFLQGELNRRVLRGDLISLSNLDTMKRGGWRDSGKLVYRAWEKEWAKEKSEKKKKNSLHGVFAATIRISIATVCRCQETTSRGSFDEIW
jgi:hypothetical protein